MPQIKQRTLALGLSSIGGGAAAGARAALLGAAGGSCAGQAVCLFGTLGSRQREAADSGLGRVSCRASVVKATDDSGLGVRASRRGLVVVQGLGAEEGTPQGCSSTPETGCV